MCHYHCHMEGHLRKHWPQNETTLWGWCLIFILIKYHLQIFYSDLFCEHFIYVLLLSILFILDNSYFLMYNCEFFLILVYIDGMSHTLGMYFFTSLCFFFFFIWVYFVDVCMLNSLLPMHCYHFWCLIRVDSCYMM